MVLLLGSEHKRDLVNGENLLKKNQAKLLVMGVDDGNGRGQNYGTCDPTSAGEERKKRESEDENRMCDLQVRLSFSIASRCYQARAALTYQRMRRIKCDGKYVFFVLYLRRVE